MTRVGLLILVLMFAAAASAIAMKPQRVSISPDQRVDYENLIPKDFSTWSVCDHEYPNNEDDQ